MCPLTIKDGRARRCIGADCMWWVTPTMCELVDDEDGDLVALPVEMPGTCAVTLMGRNSDMLQP